MLELDFKISKSNFFSTDKIQKALDREERKVLSKIGAYIRRRARSSLRRRKRVSKPGQTPSIHTQGIGLKTIFFAYEASTSSVVIGPVLLNGSKKLVSSRKTVPSLMEFGGTLEIKEISYNFGETWYQQYSSQAPTGANIRRRRRKAVIAPRPFMKPALDKEIEAGTIPSAFAGLVRA